MQTTWILTIVFLYKFRPINLRYSIQIKILISIGDTLLLTSSCNLHGWNSIFAIFRCLVTTITDRGGQHYFNLMVHY